MGWDVTGCGWMWWVGNGWPLLDWLGCNVFPLDTLSENKDSARSKKWRGDRGKSIIVPAGEPFAVNLHESERPRKNGRLDRAASAAAAIRRGEAATVRDRRAEVLENIELITGGDRL